MVNGDFSIEIGRTIGYGSCGFGEGKSTCVRITVRVKKKCTALIPVILVVLQQQPWLNPSRSFERRFYDVVAALIIPPRVPPPPPTRPNTPHGGEKRPSPSQLPPHRPSPSEAAAEEADRARRRHPTPAHVQPEEPFLVELLLQPDAGQRFRLRHRVLQGLLQRLHRADFAVPHLFLEEAELRPQAQALRLLRKLLEQRSIRGNGGGAACRRRPAG